MARPTTSAEAAKMAKRLTGSYANLRPHDPDGFIASIAAVLAQYPARLVEECCDPRIGIARKVEFLSVKSLAEWCDAKLAFYQSLAAHKPVLRLAPPELPPEQAKRGLAAFRGILKTLGEPDKLRAMTYDEAVQIGEADLIKAKP